MWTLPNVISFARILLLGLFCWLLIGPDERIAATVVLMVVGVTDFLDGYLARRFHQVSTLGKVLDPVADRVVLVDRRARDQRSTEPSRSGWPAVVLGPRASRLARRCSLSPLSGQGASTSLWAGKAGTFGLMCCFPLFLLGDGHAGWARVLTDVTWVALVPALVFSFAAAVAYVPLARRALSERSSVPARHEAVST